MFQKREVPGYLVGALSISVALYRAVLGVLSINQHLLYMAAEKAGLRET